VSERVEVTRTTFEDPALRAWWTCAYEENRLKRNTFFQSWQWNRLWSTYFVEPDPRREPVLLMMKKEGSIVAAAPLFLQMRRAGPLTAWRYLLFLGDRLAQYTDLVTTDTDTTAVWGALLAWIETTYPGSWLLLHDVLPESTVAGTGLHARHDRGELYLRVSLANEDADSLIERADAHMRREVRRARRMFDREEALTWSAVRSPDAQLVDALIRLNRERFGTASWFEQESHRAFFHDAVAAAGHEAVFTVLRHDGEIVHVMASWIHAGSMLYVLSGMDEQYKRYSPGTMNLDRSICFALEQGCTFFDFLRGDERYKREFNPQQRRSEHCTLHTARSLLRYRAARTVQRLMQSRQQRRELQ